MVFKKNWRNSTAFFYVISFGCFVGLIACNEPPKTSPSKKIIPSAITIKTFEGENGWGYDIYRNGNKYIHQPTKPAVGGNVGFKTELQAQKVAELVVEKIEKGRLPPSLKAVEVDSLTQLFMD
jgi:hypothetical protein